MAGSSVQGYEGQYANGLTYHNGQWWTAAGWAAQQAAGVEPTGVNPAPNGYTYSQAANNGQGAYSPTQPRARFLLPNGTWTEDAGLYQAAINAQNERLYPASGSRSSSSSSGYATPLARPVTLAQITADYDRMAGQPLAPPPAGPAPLPPPPSYQAPAPFQRPSPGGAADSTAADAAAFARAKDLTGSNTRASIDALRNEFSARGLLGSNLEGSGIASAINTGQGKLSDVATEQAKANVARANQVADRNYAGDLTASNAEYAGGVTGAQTAFSGGLTARGQNLSAADAAYQGALTARGQDAAAQDSRRQSILALARMAPGGLLY